MKILFSYQLFPKEYPFIHRIKISWQVIKTSSLGELRQLPKSRAVREVDDCISRELWGEMALRKSLFPDTDCEYIYNHLCDCEISMYVFMVMFCKM